MKTTLNITGMSCAHCAARVEKALQAVEGVTTVEVNHKKGTAIVTSTAPLNEDALKSAVQEAGYEVTEIK